MAYALRYGNTFDEWCDTPAVPGSATRTDSPMGILGPVFDVAKRLYNGAVENVVRVREVHAFVRDHGPLLNRLVEFTMEDEGWDGEGSIPASDATIETIIEFISALPADIRSPGAAMGGDGSVALVWQDDDGRYVTADFGGTGTYVFLIDDCGKYSGGSQIPATYIPDELKTYLTQNFMH